MPERLRFMTMGLNLVTMLYTPQLLAPEEDGIHQVLTTALLRLQPESRIRLKSKFYQKQGVVKDEIKNIPCRTPGSLSCAERVPLQYPERERSRRRFPGTDHAGRTIGGKANDFVSATLVKLNPAVIRMRFSVVGSRRRYLETDWYLIATIPVLRILPSSLLAGIRCFWPSSII